MKAPQRRRSILASAETLFAKLGYRRTTTAAIAREAGVTEPILYRHFENKRDLFHALLREISGRTMSELKHLLGGLRDPSEKVRVLARSFPAVARKLADTYRVMLTGITEIDEAGTRKILRDHFRSYGRFIEGILKDLEACREGRLDPKFAAYHLIDLAVGYALLDPVGIPTCKGEEYVWHAIGFIAKAFEETAGTRTKKGP
jgi:AcrR family transcriptional regulator